MTRKYLRAIVAHRSFFIAAFVYPALLLIVNVAIAGKLFAVEHSAYLESNEASFIAIAQRFAAHPLDLGWWPFWECGLPFQNTYLPLLQVIVGSYSRLTGSSAALSFHQVSAAFFCLGPLTVYLMAWKMSGRHGASMFAALAYSLVSPGAWLSSAIRADLGGPWNLRRLQTLAYYGEGPHTASLTILPLAILFLYLAFTKHTFRFKVATGLFFGATVLTNAFGGVIFGIASLCLLVTIRTDRFWTNFKLLAIIGALTYAVISPLLPPSVIDAIRLNSPTVDGDYHLTSRGLAGIGALFSGFLCLWWATRKINSILRFLLLFTLLTSGIALFGVWGQVYLLPQPHRYEIASEMGICLLVIFAGADLLRRFRAALIPPVAVLLLLAASLQLRHDLRFAHGLIRATDIASTEPYRIARWMDEHMHGQRVMVSGSYSFQFNEFTDTPQLFGGHDPMLPNFIMRIASFAIYNPVKAGSRDAATSVLWLKALGAHAISVPGPRSREYFKPFGDPHKFDGVLPQLWREGDDAIYAVPARSTSLAHIIPAEAAVRHKPVNGLDVREMERYVAALDDPTLSEAPLIWRDRHRAEIHTTLQPRQAVSIQITYTPGWTAAINGAPEKVLKDGLGFLLLEPECQGQCEIILTYDGGTEWALTCLASLAVLSFLLFLSVRSRWR